ncbi:MAG: acyl-CoA thioesterase [Thiogranum sp.]|nr:acyl-CoA thioesterase [Thiogranum sp.]
MPREPDGKVAYLAAVPAGARFLHSSLYSMRWSDMDAFGHVNNACYFTYFEQVRVDWLDAIGCGHDLVLANVSCSFLKPLKFPATLEVRLYAGEPGRSSLDSYYEILDHSQNRRICAVGHGTIVWYDHRNGHSVPIPVEVLRHLGD